MNPSSEFERNRIRTSNFLACSFLQEKSNSPVESAEICFNTNFAPVNSSDIISCANSDEGKALLAEMGRQTEALTPPLTSAPVITFSGVQSSVSKNFFDQLCTIYGVSSNL